MSDLLESLAGDNVNSATEFPEYLCSCQLGFRFEVENTNQSIHWMD